MLTLLFYFSGFGIIWSTSSQNFTETHHTLGLGLVLLALFQGILGQVGHMVFRSKGVRIQNYFHMAIGIVLIPAAVYEMNLGFELWSWNPPKAASVVVSCRRLKYSCVGIQSLTHASLAQLYIWAGVLAVIYVAGLAYGLPRERRANREREAQIPLVDRAGDWDDNVNEKTMLTHSM